MAQSYMVCQICGSAAGDVYRVREMMFGTRDEFRYFACGDCGCVQLTEPPRNLQAYYPSDYYAFGSAQKPRGLKRWMKRLRNRGLFAPRGIVDRALAIAFPGPIPHSREWMRRAGASPSSRILDVGCGSGVLLSDLAEAGFTSLRGVDRFIEKNVQHANGVRIERGTIDDITGMFDLIMMHHAFEHMDDPRGVLRSVAERLAPGGCCLVRIPTASSWAWEHYREHWVQLDAPRHFFLHTERSLRLVAGGAGLRLEAIVDDSSAFQFAGSELYRRDQPLSSLDSAYTRSELRDFNQRAKVLNAQRRGDQASFYLRKT